VLKFDFDRFANKALNTIGDVLVEQAQDNMQEVSFGRTYIIGGKAHIASKAGDTANNESGALSKTIRFEISGKVLEFGAGNSKIKYAKFLELGTSKMDKRPNYTKSILQNKSKIDKVVKSALMNSIRFTK
jgi:HK97 gp10 family phage protein